MKLTNQKTDDVYKFEVNRWMSRNEDDFDVWRELPVVLPGQPVLPGMGGYLGENACMEGHSHQIKKAYTLLF